MKDRRSRLTALLGALALVAAACGGGDDETAEETTTTAEATETTEAADETEDEVLVEARELDAIVQYAGFEYELVDLEPVDEDPNLPAFGSNFAVNATAVNLSDRTRTPGPEVNLQWDDDAGNVVQSSGRADFREVPGDSSGSGTFLFNVAPDDAEEFDEASARIVLGRSGTAQVVVPLGDAVELVSRLPVEQEAISSFDLDGLTFDVQEVWVVWDNVGEGSQVDDGTAILELWGPMENGRDAQHCIGSTRGRTEPVITLPDGTSRTLLGSNVNCLASGETERNAVVAFEIDDPYAGEYELTIEGGSQLEVSDTGSFELVEGDGVSSEQRRAARDADDVDDLDDPDDPDDDTTDDED